MEQVVIGDNVPVRINLFDKTGAAQVIGGLYSITVYLEQQGRIIETYTYTSPTGNELRQGDNNTQLLLEITQAVSKKLSEGIVYVRVLTYKTDADFIKDSGRRKDSGVLLQAFEAVYSTEQ